MKSIQLKSGHYFTTTQPWSLVNTTHAFKRPRPFGLGNSINQSIVIDSVVQWMLRSPLSIWVCAQLTAVHLEKVVVS